MSQEPGSGEVLAAFEAAIERELGDPRLHRRDLRTPACELSQRYRSAQASRDCGPHGKGELEAYLATRVPATFAATTRVLAELALSRPGWAPESILDLGAGPGTATWAATGVFASLERAVLVERDPEMAALGARLAHGPNGPNGPNGPSGLGGRSGLLAHAEWSVADAAQLSAPRSDLVVAAYLLGELGHDRDRERSALERWWAATLGELVLVEPGTPAGFERLRAVRSALISWGAHVSAPCPHDERCPMTGSDWCHFAVRLERSGLHRDLKGGRLGYEDEKYSYLAVSSSAPGGRAPRLVRSPRQHKGHVRLQLCEVGGLNERVVSRRDGEVYKRARAARWGDRLAI